MQAHYWPTASALVQEEQMLLRHYIDFVPILRDFFMKFVEISWRRLPTDNFFKCSSLSHFLAL